MTDFTLFHDTGDRIIDEATHLAGTNTPANIARRLGYKTPNDLYKNLTRKGRQDLIDAIRNQRPGRIRTGTVRIK